MSDSISKSLRDQSSTSFKVFDLLQCPNCTKSATMTTNDGNRTQICLGCKKVLLQDGIKPIN